MSRKLITVDGSDLIAEVSEVSECFWVTIAYLGAHGIAIDSDEWKAFVNLINKTDEEIKRLK